MKKTEHNHHYVMVYVTQAGKEEVWQCSCGAGYVYNREIDKVY